MNQEYVKGSEIYCCCARNLLLDMRKGVKKSVFNYFATRGPLKIEIVTTQQRNNLPQF